MKRQLCSTVECPPRSFSVVGFVSQLARDVCLLWRCTGILFSFLRGILYGRDEGSTEKGKKKKKYLG